MSIKYGISRQKQDNTEAYDELEENLYVDNVLLTADDSESLVRKQFMTNDAARNRLIEPTRSIQGKERKNSGNTMESAKRYLLHKVQITV
ncbi:unnamed protein product [Cylicocyclus nassatus]|uniref:Uncharacterized protein n=1 Tax=Cylicocyclus nassatus TaxID=53992 RepID=A0AA36H9J9_CYLNA|nr:unnamed protein product [Cylicocyclus nassatus]